MDEETIVHEPVDIRSYHDNGTRHEYEFAVCKCPLPNTFGIPIKLVKGRVVNRFYCPACKTRGILYTPSMVERIDIHGR